MSKLSRSYIVFNVDLKMKVEIHRFRDGRLQLLIRFEKDSNFRTRDLTWVPRKEEVKLINESLQALDEYNIIKSKLAKIYR